MIKVVGSKFTETEEKGVKWTGAVQLPTFYLDTADFEAAIIWTEALTGVHRDYLSLGMVKGDDESTTMDEYRSHKGEKFK